MRKLEPYERRFLEAFDKGALKSIATRTEVAKFKAAARAPPSRIDGSTFASRPAT